MTLKYIPPTKLAEEVKRVIGSALEAYKQRDKNVKTLEDIHETRRSEWLSIFQIYGHVAELLAQTPEQKSSAEFTPSAEQLELYHLLYGAALVAQAHSGVSSGKLYEGVLQILADSKPDEADLLACYTAYNKFMHAQVFVEADSRKGLQNGLLQKGLHIKAEERHIFASLGATELRDLVKKGYALENAMQLAALKTPVDATKAVEYGLQTPLTALTPFTQGKKDAWTSICDSLEQLIRAELGKKGTTVLKNLVPIERANQLIFLDEFKNTLKEAQTINGNEKTAILAGAMYLVRGEIKISYDQSYKIPMTSRTLAGTTEEDSYVFDQLGVILGKEHAHPADVEALINAVNRVLNHNVIAINPEPLQAAVVQTTHNKRSAKRAEKPVEPKPIVIATDELFGQTINLAAYRICAQEMICTQRTKAAEELFAPAIKLEQQRLKKQQQEQKEEAASKKGTSWFGLGIFGGSAKTDPTATPSTANVNSAVSPVVKEEKQEKKTEEKHDEPTETLSLGMS